MAKPPSRSGGSGRDFSRGPTGRSPGRKPSGGKNFIGRPRDLSETPGRTSASRDRPARDRADETRAPKSDRGERAARGTLTPRARTAEPSAEAPRGRKDARHPGKPGGKPTARPAAKPSGRPARQPAPHAAHAPAPFAEGTPHEIADNGERIAKLLARAGIASRREVERLIAEGRVKLDDVTISTPATILKTLKGITVDGKPVRTPEPARLWAFHKPQGLITAERDPAGRPTIYTALRNALPAGTPRLMPVGRLDLNTEGLLLLTNDGELKRAMELPSTGVPRTYRARTFGDITQARLEELIEGVTIEGVHYGRIDANMERRTGRNQWVELTLTEGKNREVRRVLEHLGLQVSRLIRVAYGPFALADLPRGTAVPIRQQEVERFRKSLKADRTADRAKGAED